MGRLLQGCNIAEHWQNIKKVSQLTQYWCQLGKWMYTHLLAND